MMNGPRPDRKLWALAAAVAPLAILAAAFFIQPRMTYNRWDNFEWFTPALSYAHGQLLAGTFPHWNPHQFLGEPLHAQTQAGVLYLPYTLALLLARMTGLGDQGVTTLILLIHLPGAGWGWYRLMRQCCVRPSLALLTAVCATGGGYLTAMASVWIFIVPVFTWLPWLLFALVRLAGERARARDLLLLFVGLTAVAYVGHPQFLVYTWLMAGMFALAWSMIVTRRPARLARLPVPCLAAALASAPALLPTYNLLQFTARADRMELADFLNRSVLPEALLSILLPLYRLPDGMFTVPANVVLHQGGWMLPAILAAGLFLVPGVGKPDPENGPAERAPAAGAVDLNRAYVAAVLVATLFILLALGKYGPLYRLTYGIPVWSSFRWPFKFLLLANPLVSLAAGLAIEVCARRRGSRGGWLVSAGVGVAVAVLTIFVLMRHPSPLLATTAGKLCLVAGVPLVALAALAGQHRVRGVILALAFVETVGVVALSHSLGLKTYDEPYGAYGPKTLGIDPAYRVLPLTAPELLGMRPAMQPYDLFVAATANGYDSATGCMFWMNPVWCYSVLPADVSGILPPSRAAELLGSNLLRSLNVRYVIAGRNDPSARALVERTGGYRPVGEVDGAIVYDNGSDLPRAYFASNVYPYSDAGFTGGMIRNGVQLRSAFVEGADGVVRPGSYPAGQVESARWNPNDVRLQVNARDGGFLVLSMTWFPEWSATIDGRQTPVYRVNGTLQGVVVPPGGRQVEVHYRPVSLYRGIALAAVGGVMLSVWLGFRRRILRAVSGQGEEKVDAVG